MVAGEDDPAGAGEVDLRAETGFGFAFVLGRGFGFPFFIRKAREVDDFDAGCARSGILLRCRFRSARDVLRFQSC
jgi:hypothetical protein